MVLKQKTYWIRQGSAPVQKVIMRDDKSFVVTHYLVVITL